MKALHSGAQSGVGAPARCQTGSPAQPAFMAAGEAPEHRASPVSSIWNLGRYPHHPGPKPWRSRVDRRAWMDGWEGEPHLSQQPISNILAEMQHGMMRAIVQVIENVWVLPERVLLRVGAGARPL